MDHYSDNKTENKTDNKIDNVNKIDKNLITSDDPTHTPNTPHTLITVPPIGLYIAVASPLSGFQTKVQVRFLLIPSLSPTGTFRIDGLEPGKKNY